MGYLVDLMKWLWCIGCCTGTAVFSTFFFKILPSWSCLETLDLLGTLLSFGDRSDLSLKKMQSDWPVAGADSGFASSWLAGLLMDLVHMLSLFWLLSPPFLLISTTKLRRFNTFILKDQINFFLSLDVIYNFPWGLDDPLIHLGLYKKVCTYHNPIGLLGIEKDTESWRKWGPKMTEAPS